MNNVVPCPTFFAHWRIWRVGKWAIQPQPKQRSSRIAYARVVAKTAASANYSPIWNEASGSFLTRGAIMDYYRNLKVPYFLKNIF